MCSYQRVSPCFIEDVYNGLEGGRSSFWVEGSGLKDHFGI